MTTPDGNPTRGSATTPTADWAAALPSRLQSQLAFLLAIDALKTVQRATRIATGERPENSAEHSWHLTLFAQTLAEHADEAVNVERVVLMLMVHDIVEVDAGDTPLHGAQDPQREAREQAAASRLFGLLPADQADLLKACWAEFEAADSADARFARAIDRLQPILLNALNEGGSWRDFDVSLEQVRVRTAGIAKGSQTLWQVANAIFNEAVERGWLRTDPPADSS